MDKNQKLLITLLSAAIRGKRIEKAETEGVDWRTVFDEAKTQEVHTLIYSTVKSLHMENLPDDKLMAEWHRATLAAGISQIHHMQRVNEVLKAFNETGIPVIALKGLILRQLYPQPEARTMCDADILVHKEDIIRAKTLLLAIGYHKDKNDSNHININFTHDTHLNIEVHWSIAYKEFMNSQEYTDDALWARAVQTDVGNVPVLSLSREDQLLHLCLHMTAHFIGGWLSLRQLCDLVLFVESNYHLIDWSSFFDIINASGTINFIKVIFLVCKLLFCMNIPDILYDEDLENDPFLMLLIKDIFRARDSGYDYKTRMFSGAALFYSRNSKKTPAESKIKYYISLLFPSSNKMGEKYSYSRKYPLLIPAAWLHRIVHCCFRNDISISDKVWFFSLDSAEAFKNRAKLLHWLELR